MSFKYAAFKKMTQSSKAKKKLAQPLDDILFEISKSPRIYRMPKFTHALLDVHVEEFRSCDVYYIKHRQAPAENRKVCLYVNGAHMLWNPDQYHVKRGVGICLNTGYDVIAPYYPLCIYNPVSSAVNMLYDLYKTMLRDYAPENIQFVGFSSGAALLMSLISHIHEMGEGLPVPSKIYIGSPETTIKTQEEWNEAVRLNDSDILVDCRYLVTLKDVLRHGMSSTPDYMVYLRDGNYTGLKKAYICYGSDEVTRATYPGIKAALESAGAEVTTEIGEGLFHCYPIQEDIPEVEAGWNNMISFIKE